MKLRTALILWLFSSASLSLPQTQHPQPLPPLLWQTPHQQWKPPAGLLPDDYVKGANRLLAAGFGDPRGGEYRVVYTGLMMMHSYDEAGGKPTQHSVLKESHGWYFPAQNGVPARAVLTDGITCAPVKVGPKADLDADIQIALKNEGRSFSEYFDPCDLDESHGILMLCLAARTDDAKKLGAKLINKPSYPTNPDLKALDIRDAMEFFWSATAAYSSTSYLYGHTALCYQVTTLQRNVEKVFIHDIIANGKLYPSTSDDRGARLTKIVVELERRLRHPEASLDPTAIARLAQKDRIHYLIQKLDQIEIQRTGFHSLANQEFVNTPEVRELIAEGPAAIEPILDCIQNDNALTRSYDEAGFSEVREAALAAYRGIIQFDFVLPGFHPYGFEPPKWGPDHNVPDLTRKWSELGGLTPSDRYFKILSDDNAEPMMWYEAAVRLLCPQDLNLQRSYPFGGRELTDFQKPLREHPFNNSLSKNKGAYDEPLSPNAANYGPALSSLLAKRATQILEQKTPHAEEGLFNTRHAMTLVRYLSSLDPKAALPLLKQTFDLYCGLDNSKVQDGIGDDEPIWAFKLRAKLGDPDAFSDYLKALAVQNFADSNLDYNAWLEPLLSEDTPQSGAVLDQLFNGKDSSWNPSNQRYAGTISNRIVSPLLVVPQFRKAVLRLLDDKTQTNQATSQDNLDAQYPLAPGETRVIRLCDDLAADLCYALAEAPKFNRTWPEKQKDETILELKHYFSVNGPNMAGCLPIFFTDGWSKRRSIAAH